MKNIVLIGFMGSGKSTIGSRLARRLRYQFVDTDYEIEQVTDLTVAQIFAKYGVKRFRGEEALLVSKLADRKGLVIATGGGLVIKPENVEQLKKNGILIGLEASPETICKRVRNKRTRPLLARRNLQETVERMLEERKDAYSVAEFTVNVDRLAPDQAVDIIIEYLKRRQYIL
ncbi:shikimate kinase [Desulforamulus ruminis]|uniref:shikimate kinase n=1 Tax=Desulforamulus ruminis TaxID=1564 RepID=UPI002355FB79|nr:shikimate kinase [Desulforamulus ruminis]